MSPYAEPDATQRLTVVPAGGARDQVPGPLRGFDGATHRPAQCPPSGTMIMIKTGQFNKIHAAGGCPGPASGLGLPGPVVA
jgi:hypothetical protein